MARHKEAERETIVSETRERLLQAATEEFAREGYVGANINRISRAAGFAKGNATVSLEPDGDATLLKYDVEATVGGKLAQIGSRLVDAAARKFADDFFSRFNEIVSVDAAPMSEVAPESGLESVPETSRGLPTVVWAAGLIAVVGLLLLLFS